MGERETSTNNSLSIETDESILPEGITQINKQTVRAEQPNANIGKFEFSTNRLPTDPSIAPSQG